MKTLRLLLGLALSATLPIQAQAPPMDPALPLLPATLTTEQLDQLLAPIALYPDALIALILPASTHPADIVLAARYLKESPNDFSQVEHRAWDDSIKSLIHYPDVLRWMDENLTWTKQVGEAFAAQPADVMNAIQRLRSKARASGALANTPQQQVLSESEVIRIVPADPEILYVPRYDPAVVFVDRPFYYSSLPPLLTFGAGWRVGSWLAYDFDWRRCTLWVGDRHRHWHGRHDWRKPIVPIAPVSAGHANTHRFVSRPWQPPTHLHRPVITRGTNPTHRTYRPADAGALAPTYGRNSAPVQRPGGHVSPPDVRPPPPAGATAPWLFRPPTHPSTSNRNTAIARPTSPPADPNSHRHSGDWRRDSGRIRPSGSHDAPAQVRPALPTAPPLNTVGPISMPRPTVVAAPMNRTVSPPASGSGLAPRTVPHSRPAFSSPPPSVAPAPAPSARPAPQVQAPAPPAAPASLSPQPVHRAGSHDDRRHGRSELP